MRSKAGMIQADTHESYQAQKTKKSVERQDSKDKFLRNGTARVEQAHKSSSQS